MRWGEAKRAGTRGRKIPSVRRVDLFFRVVLAYVVLSLVGEDEPAVRATHQL